MDGTVSAITVTREMVKSVSAMFLRESARDEEAGDDARIDTCANDFDTYFPHGSTSCPHNNRPMLLRHTGRSVRTAGEFAAGAHSKKK